MSEQILVIEDDQVLLENITFFLQKNGFSVHGVDNGLDGLKQIKSLQPDLVICDINLPDISGLEVFSQISSTFKNSFIFLTANTSLQDIRKGLQLGADDYLTKPFRLSDLIETIKVRLNKVKQLQKETKGTFELFRTHLNLPYIVIEGETIISFSDSISTIPFKQKLTINKKWGDIFELYVLEEESEESSGKTIQIRSGGMIKRALQIHEPFSSFDWILFIDDKKEINPDLIKDKYELTNKEFDVAKEIAKGLTNQEIAENLNLSVRTIDWHRTNLFSKLEVRNRTEFIIKFSN